MTFWFLARVVWMENHLYVYGMSRLGSRAVYAVFFVPTAYLHSLRAAVFCFKKRSVFIALFLPFWESYFSISPFRRMHGIEWKKTVKIINISIYNSLVVFSFRSAEIVLFFLSISSSPSLFCYVSIPRDAFWLLAAPQAYGPDRQRWKWEILNKHRAREMKTCAIEIRIGKFQFLLLLLFLPFDVSILFTSTD